MKITIEQLQVLLNQQKGLCSNHFDKVWRESEFLKELMKIDPEGKVANKMHELRDRISGAPFPNDFDIIKKYEL